MKTIVIALGGNALIARGQKGATSEQFDNARRVCAQIVEVIKQGHRVIITHGNGPQVGFLLRQSELASSEVPPLSLDFCDAATQGTIGYMIQQALTQEFARAEIKKPVGTIITQVLVSRNDPAFKNPSKPIGSFYSREQARELARERGWTVVEDAGRGWRRVVPSPKPIGVVERALIRELIARDIVVVACGGGGIPVVREPSGELRGVEAVIDKDSASCVLAKEIGADSLVFLTQVPCVFLDFGKPSQRELREFSVAEAKRFLEEGQFPPGSMEPKIEAAIDFVASGTGSKEALVTSPELLLEALDGKAGTKIIA